MGLGILVGKAQLAAPVEQQGGIGTVCDLADGRLRLGQARCQRDAGIGDVGGGGIHPRDQPPRRAGLAAPQQIVQPRPVVGRGQQAAVLLHDGQFHIRLKTAIGPALADQQRTARLLATGHQRFAQPYLADAGIGFALAEPGDHLSRCHIRGQGGFRARLQGAAQRPLGSALGVRVADHRVDLGKSGAAILVQGVAPLQQPLGQIVLSLGCDAARRRPVAAAGGLEGAQENVVVGGRQVAQPAGPHCGKSCAAPASHHGVGHGRHHHHRPHRPLCRNREAAHQQAGGHQAGAQHGHGGHGLSF